MTAITTHHRGPAPLTAWWRSYRSVATWCAPAEPDTTEQPWRIVVSVACLAVLAVALAGQVEGSATVRAAAGSVYLLGGVGASPLLLTDRRAGDSLLALSLAVSLGWVITVGLVMAEVGPWAPGPAFAGTAAVSAGLHLLGIGQTTRRLRRQRAWHRPERPRSASAPGPVVATARLVPSLLDRSTLCSATGLALTVASSISQRHLDPGPSGVFAVLPVTWYLGLLLLVAGFVLGRGRPARDAAFAAMGLVAALATTPSTVYDAFQLPYAAKHLGVTSLILARHHVSFNGDIYQAWPGLFSGTAWLTRAVGLGAPTEYARWWPVLIALGVASGIRMLAGRLGLSPYRAWAAALVFTLASTFDQAYFAPQSTAFMLALVVFALALRVTDETRGQRRLRLGLALWLSLVVIPTHQITPYFIVGALAVMCVFRLVRSWWLPVVTAVAAIGWAYAHRSLLGPFLSPGALGNLGGNVAPPAHASVLGYEPVVNLTFYGAAATAVAVGAVALVALARGRSLRHWGMALAASSAGTLIAASNYGGEAIFRVVLFALPWLAILALTLPGGAPAGRHGSLRRWTVGWAGVLVGLVGIYAFTSFSLDWAHVVRPGALRAVTAFEERAPKGSVLVQTGTPDATPTDLTASYGRVTYTSRQDLDDLPDPHRPYDARADVQRLAADTARRGGATARYALVSQEIGAYDALYGLEQLGRYQAFAAAMAHSPWWQPVVAGPDATLYRLHLPPGGARP